MTDTKNTTKKRDFDFLITKRNSEFYFYFPRRTMENRTAERMNVLTTPDGFFLTLEAKTGYMLSENKHNPGTASVHVRPLVREVLSLFKRENFEVTDFKFDHAKQIDGLTYYKIMPTN